jgi:hypothetical protein
LQQSEGLFPSAYDARRLFVLKISLIRVFVGGDSTA